MKRILSAFLAFVMVATIVSVPLTDNIYGETQTNVVNSLEQKDIGESDFAIDLDKEQYEYTGSEIKVTLSHDGNALTENVDYKVVSYENNVKVGTASLKIQGMGAYKGEKTLNFEIVPADISKAEAALDVSSYTYDCSEKKPKVTAKFNGAVLQENVDYQVSYEDNVYPGKGNVVITGIGNFTSTKKVEFKILSSVTLKTKTQGTSYVTLQWKKANDVTGYEIQRYNSSSKKWVDVTRIENKNTESYSVKKLTKATTYKFRIRTYVVDEGGSYHYGEWSKSYRAATAPGKVVFSKLSTNVRMDLKIYWKKGSCSGYQIYVSRDSKFKKVYKYNITSSSKTSKVVSASKHGEYYYVKLRAYKEVDGKRVYGDWSNTKKIKTNGNGWGTFDGCKYYYKNGKAFTGSHKINGNKYYFNKKGILVGASAGMYRNVKDETSKTKYLISVSRTKNRLCVYHKVDGEWVVKYYWKCSTGARGLISPISKTPSGVFTVPKKRTRKLHFGDPKGYRCWYATRIYKGYYFHSITYQPYSKTRIRDGRLGQNVSHGCIRLATKNAKWIYDNIKAGTKVVILGVS